MYSSFALRISVHSKRCLTSRSSLQISRQRFTTNADISTPRVPCLLSKRAIKPRRRPLESVRRPQSSYFRSESNTSSSSSARRKSTITPQHMARQESNASEPDVGEALRHLREALHAFLLKPRTVPLPRWISPRLYTVTFSECLGHSSFILVAVSYATDDFLMLRTIAVLGSTCMLFFTYFHPHGRILWLPFKWNCLFIAINAYRIGAVIVDRYAARALSDEMLKLREDHFFVMGVVDFAKLVRLAEVETFEPGDMIVGQGFMNRYIRVIVEGDAECFRDGVKTYTLERGNFVSEGGLHAGLMLPGALESCCTIAATQHQRGQGGKLRVLRWDRTKLMEFLKSDSHLRRALKAALSWDIVRKLKGQRRMLITGQVNDPVLWTEKRNVQNDNRYAAVVQNILSHPHHMELRRDELRRYRNIHHIDDEHHLWALNRCGWTLEEFERGQRLRRRDSDRGIESGDEWKISNIFGTN
uniref:Cyclic nucleotide-binding domain-containing protein n=2 Tax=Ditylum brightwellii TaxID=49249 RepID=A0A7S4R060_9STRA|mmetsp:Transcript_34702/g.46557  ORF Transcript_34702/g.46557 Transcript_34702/m.46557 type:complete len:472 (-) Transcript_34702:694-2109(-)